MKNLLIEIPSDILMHIRIPEKRLVSGLKQELAVQLYRDKLLSFANCSRLAEMTKTEFQLLIQQSVLLAEIG